MAKLGVNIDHIATLRQARKAKEPELIVVAKICELAGAQGITVHLREDRRHIQERDVELLRKTITTKLNMEMSIAPEIVNFAVAVKPDDVCLVTEKRQELTTEGGLDVSSKKQKIAAVIRQLHSAGIRVSIFIDPEEEQVKASSVVGADCIELHTGAYASAYEKKSSQSTQFNTELTRLKNAAQLANSLGLIVNAGHGLDYKNIIEVARIAEINEFNIGFSIVARAVLIGLEKAVKEMKDLINT